MEACEVFRRSELCVLVLLRLESGSDVLSLPALDFVLAWREGCLSLDSGGWPKPLPALSSVSRPVSKSSEFASTKGELGLEAVEGQGGKPTDFRGTEVPLVLGKSFSGDSHLPSGTEKPGTSALSTCVA